MRFYVRNLFIFGSLYVFIDTLVEAVILRYMTIFTARIQNDSSILVLIRQCKLKRVFKSSFSRLTSR